MELRNIEKKQNMKKITIAIDGHSSCGKSTMAKDLAREVGYVYVDTGAMYRSVTLFALRNGLFTADGIDEETLRQRMPEIKISFKFNAETGRPDTYLNGVKAEFLTIDEDLCVQIMHIGSFDDEPATVEKMNKYLAENGYENDFSETRLHHEIYLSDARKVDPEKWKTVIRHPIRKR